MKRKHFILALVAMLSSFSMTTYAQNVAKVGNTEYATIDEAIAAWTNNTTLTLLSDVTLSDVVTLKSTEHHILNLGTYTMTAASGKNAFVIQACGTGSAERSAITINADATNPGGINAGSKCVVYYKYADGGISTEDRPIIKINGGVFTGSTSSFGTAGIYTIGTAARKCATVNIAGGTFDCSIVGSGKSKLIVSGGLFNYTVSSQGDSTCSRLISGGTFKTLGFMTADSNNTKFWIGTSMGDSNVGVHVDDNGYIVVGGPVVTEAGESFEASSANYSGASSYLQYSSAVDYGLYYTSVEEAFADNNKASGSVTVYVDELDMTGISYKGTIVVPEGEKITIVTAEGVTPAWTVTANEDAVTYTDAEGNELVKDENGSFAPVPAVTVDGVDVVITENGNSYDIKLVDGATFPENGVTMTFAATGDANGMAYVVHEHEGKNYIYVGKVGTDDKISFKNTVGFSTFTVNAGGLTEAVAAAQSGDIIVLMNGEYELPLFAGKELTFVGESKEGVIVNDAPAAVTQGWNGSTFHFENLTAKGATGANANYHGLANGVKSVTYKDCNINGLRFLYATESVSFDGCAFNANGVEHSFWTYGASNITVTNSTFTYTDRAVNCYSESGAEHETDITFEGCSFTYAGTADAPEGAVEINSGSVKSINLTMNECTAPEKGAMWFNSQWDSKKGENTVVKVDDVIVWQVVKVAKIGETKYATLEEAFAAAAEGETITLLADATPALTSQRAITKAAVIDLGDKTMTLTEDDLYFGTTTFKNGTIVVDPSVKPSTAVFWMFANQTLTFDNVKIVATGVTGTYLIGLEGENSDLNLLNGSEILVENTTALDLDIICVNGTNTCDIKVENSKVNVTNLDGRVFFRGNYTVKDSEVSLAGITKAGFRIEAGQTLSIEGYSVVNITGEPRDGGIHLTDLSATYTKAETATVNATVNEPKVAKVGENTYRTLALAVAAVEDGGTITLIANETFTENNRYNNGGWWEGLGYSGDKSFTIDLANFTISQDGALNDYLMWFKNDGAKANTITLKNGTLDAGSTAFCALATASSNAQKITVNLENIKVINNKNDGSTVKVRGGAELNVKAGTVITGKDSYLGIECIASTANIYEGAEIYMNGTSSYNGCLAGVGGNGTINVYGGKGTGVSGGFIAMTSGGTINVEGGEWIANNDGTYANSNKSVLVAQSDKQNNTGAGNSIVNVTGGTFKGGYNCYGNAAGDAQINIKGGNFNANPTSYVAEDYIAVENNGVWNVVKPVAKIGEQKFATLQEALEAAAVGETVTILAGDFTQNLDVQKAITVAGETDAEGNNLVNFTGKLSITADGATVKNINVNNGGSSAGYINAKNVTVDGCQVVGGNGFRYCYTSGTVTFKNSTITGATYGIHFDGNTGGTVVIDNCTITGWTSFAGTIEKVTMKNTRFDNGNYNYVRFYQGAELTGCSFNEKMNVDFAVDGVEVTVADCTVDGDRTVEDLFEDKDIANSTITVDDVKLARIAKIGDEYYETITAAINAAADGATVEILAGEHSEYVAPWKTDTQHKTEKSITLVGAADFATVLTGGMYLGYDDSQCREHNIVVKGIAFQGKGLTVACQQNVTIEDNKFTNITEGRAIAVIGKDINSVVKNNVIENVASAAGIELRNTLTATVEGNTISGTGHNALQITSQVGSTESTATVLNNTMSGWGVNGEGRAMRFEGIVTATVNGNVMTHTAAPEEFAKITNTTTLDASANYWNGVSPMTSGMFTGVEGDPIAVLKNYYTDAEKTNLVDFSAAGSAARIGSAYYETLAAAITAAKANDVITFVGNITEDVTISKNVTIDGDNKNYTGTMTANAGLNVTVQKVNFVNGGFAKAKSTTGTYTIKNCTFDGDGTYAYALAIRGANTVNVENCTVKDYLYGFLYVSSGTNSVSVKDVTVENCPNYAVYFGSGVNNAMFENLTVKNSNSGFVINNTANRAFTMKNCEMENVTTAINHSKGTNAITCTALGVNDLGTAVLSEYAVIKGATIEGSTLYGSVQGMVEKAEDNQTVKLLSDIALTEADCVAGADRKVLVDVAGKDITLDMNGKKISVTHMDEFTNDYIVAVIRVADGAGLTVTGNGTIDVTALDGNPDIAYMFWKRGTTGHLTIVNGTFKMNDAADSMVYTNGDEIVLVKGGTWTLDAYGTRGNREPWIFNVAGAGDKHVVVTGGTFNADINRQFWSNEVVVPETHYTVANDDETYTILEGTVAYVNEGMLTGPYFIRKNIGYATLAEAIAEVDTDETVTMLKDVTLDETLVVAADKENITLELNGKVISANIAEQLTKSFAVITNKGTLTVKDSSAEATGKISVAYGGTSFGYGVGLYTISNEGGVLNIAGGTIENTTTVDGSMYDAIDNNSTLGNTVLNISGGKVVCNQYIGIRQFANSTTHENTVNVTGGEVVGGNTSIWMQNPNSNANKATVAISGADYENGNYPIIKGRLLADESTGFNFEVIGGLFDTNVNAFCAEDYASYELGDGTWGIEYTVVDELTLVDGEFTEFVNENAKTVGTLTYKRNLSNTDLKALYVPFEIPVSQLTELGIQVFYINDFRSYNKDGEKDYVLESVLIEEGTLRANHPYLFRYADQSKVKNLELVLENTTLYSTAADKQITVDCTSAYEKFVISGTYTTMSVTDLNGSLILGGGNTWGPMAEGYSLTPFRLFLTMSNRDGSPIKDASTKAISVRLYGADGTTAIDEVEMTFDGENYIYDLQGRRVLEPQKGGLYIVNGKKVIF